VRRGTAPHQGRVREVRGDEDRQEADVRPDLHKAHRRLDGEFAETTLTPMQAAALIELIEPGTALRPKELHSVGVVHADKLIEKARQAVDVNLSRRAWRAFHTLRGSEPEAKRFQFRPPPGFRFAVVRPIGTERLKTGTERA
jgi:hypothetical protein